MTEQPRQRGFTLIELIIFIVVVGAGLAGILAVFNTSVASSADPMVRKQAIAVAESLLEEILLKDYAKPAGSAVTSGDPRAYYDCVDDYNGYHTAGGIVSPDAAASPVAGLESYNIQSVTVADASIADAQWSNGMAKKVTVVVTGPGGTSISLSGYRGNY